ncbi:MAG: pyridoxamine 5'-phosphate oxidase [Bdellovibrionaceae bacterium]|nr:pyridoxamine 5'-phosphate oxidase [Pseudobdellovibrionaceae bacterium]
MKTLHLEIKKQLGFINPLKILDHCLNQALNIKIYQKSWPMVLSTTDKKRVNSRVVLLKELNKDCLIFYTNYLSQKGLEIRKNPQVAFNFYWPQLKKQIRGQGTLKKTSRKKSILYWNTRHQESQINQWISQQSQAVADRQSLKKLRQKAKNQFKNKNVPCPNHWGGYELKIHSIEFWLEGKNRLHDRFLFERKRKLWKVKRLFP